NHVCVLVYRFKRKSIDGSSGSSDGSGNTAVSHPIAAGTPEGNNYGAIEGSSSSPGRQMSSPNSGQTFQSDTDSSVEESDFDTLPDIESDKNIIRTKVFLFLSDLSRKDRRIISKKYKIYFWNIVTIAVFYALPVIQLVITYQIVSITQKPRIPAFILQGEIFAMTYREKYISLELSPIKRKAMCAASHLMFSYQDRMVLLILGNLFNGSFALYGLIYRPRDFASYMLGIFICNLLLYLAFYIIMKLRSSEKLLPTPLLCIVATVVMWATSLYFFFQKPSSWEDTPAESRERNRECILLDFFDDHDIWHFLSATALFFSFLVLLTLDDDLDVVHRDQIPVF
ncbi:SID1 transmembrane family member 1-like, partial [Leptonychotes weddellii]|uniref:SID1 transmembrane family member 1-like n=1 Tax=Leptonychotes weddellii TaxID=9713 RepID=A0A7F8QDA9_LEPWE